MASNKGYAIGDVVKLKSGGPDMTIRSIPEVYQGIYRCQWFAGKKLEDGAFPYDSLELAKVDKK